jgi:hypothetical protein
MPRSTTRAMAQAPSPPLCFLLFWAFIFLGGIIDIPQAFNLKEKTWNSLFDVLIKTRTCATEDHKVITIDEKER